MVDLKGLRVAVLATDGFEETELTEPVRALRDAGAAVEILSNKLEPLQAFQHHDKSITVKPDRQISAADPNNYDAVLLPGGALNADMLRVEPTVQSFLRQMQTKEKPIAAICHAPWELISAGLVSGRTLTGYHTIRDDIRNAGGTWVDQEVVLDGNWITSRQPSDIPAFNQQMLHLFSLQLSKAASLKGTH